MGSSRWGERFGALRRGGQDQDVVLRPDPPVGQAQASERLDGSASFTLEPGATREDCWAQLGPRLQERIIAAAGETLAWSAFRAESAAGPRVQVTVFGRTALVIAEPTVRFRDGAYSPVHQLVRYEFAPASLLRATVTHRPELDPLHGGHPDEHAGRTGDPGPDPPAGVDAQTAQVIAAMPARGRELLTEPFRAGGDEVLRSHRFWQGQHPDHLNPVMVVLASQRRATLAIGQRLIPAGHSGATAHWLLRCWHAEVTRRAGR